MKTTWDPPTSYPIDEATAGTGAPVLQETSARSTGSGTGLQMLRERVSTMVVKSVPNRFPRRVIAFVIDIATLLPGAGLLAIAQRNVTTGESATLYETRDGSIGLVRTAAGTPTSVGLVLGMLAVVLIIGGWVANHVFLQSRTGQTVGKSLCGLQLVDEATLVPVSIGRTLHRSLVPVLLTAVTFGVYAIIDYTAAGGDPRGQRRIDRRVHTVVVDAPAVR